MKFLSAIAVATFFVTCRSDDPLEKDRLLAQLDLESLKAAAAQVSIL
jgi:hypothetical protein